MKLHLNTIYGRACTEAEKQLIKNIFEIGRTHADTIYTYKFKSDRFRYADTDSIRKEKKTMKVVENYTVPIEDIPDFLSEHIDETLIIRECDIYNGIMKVDIKQEYTEPEYHMGILLTIANSHSATEDEKKAANYAINAIKTLIDMGVLKDD